MGFGFIEMLLTLGLSTIFSEIWNHPPRDLASLLEPKAVLQQLQEPTDEKNLIALLRLEGTVEIDPAKLKQAVADLGDGNFRVRKQARDVLRAAGEQALPHLQEAAQANDPEVRISAQKIRTEISEERRLAATQDTHYIKQLMAIRALEEMKSQAALSALQGIAGGGNPTLSQAAAEAIQAIHGKAAERTKGVDGLKRIMRHLPEQAAFAAALDLERGSRRRDLKSYLDAIREAANKNPEMQMMTAQLGQMEAQMIPGLIMILGRIGNIQIDSITMLLSGDLGVEPESGYVGFLFTGLHDPDRIAAAVKGDAINMQQQEINGLTVFFPDDGHTAFCSPDKNSFILSFGPTEDGSHILPMIQAWKREAQAAPPEFLLPAFIPVINEESRLAVAGRLSESQRHSVLEELKDDLEQLRERANQAPHQAISWAFMEMCMQLAHAKQYAVQLNNDATFKFQTDYDEPNGAAELAEKVKTFDMQLRNMLKLATAEMQGADELNPIGSVLSKIDFSKPWIEVIIQGKKMTATLSGPNNLGILPMFLFMGRMF